MRLVNFLLSFCDKNSKETVNENQQTLHYRWPNKLNEKRYELKTQYFTRRSTRLFERYHAFQLLSHGVFVHL